MRGGGGFTELSRKDATTKELQTASTDAQVLPTWTVKVRVQNLGAALAAVKMALGIP